MKRFRKKKTRGRRLSNNEICVVCNKNNKIHEEKLRKIMNEIFLQENYN